MANMNLPGVRRIEALITVLKAKEKEALAALSAALPSRESLRDIVDAEFGLTEARAEAAEALAKAREAYAKIGEVAGGAYEVNVSQRYYNARDTDYAQRLSEVYAENIDVHIDALKREYKDKESALWLVESVEEAKAIVYGTAA